MGPNWDESFDLRPQQWWWNTVRWSNCYGMLESWAGLWGCASLWLPWFARPTSRKEILCNICPKTDTTCAHYGEWFLGRREKWSLYTKSQTCHPSLLSKTLGLYPRYIEDLESTAYKNACAERKQRTQVRNEKCRKIGQRNPFEMERRVPNQSCR